MNFTFTKCIYNKKYPYAPRVLHPTYYIFSKEDKQVPFKLTDGKNILDVSFKDKNETGFYYRGQIKDTKNIYLDEEVLKKRTLKVYIYEDIQKDKEITKVSNTLLNLLKENRNLCFENDKFRELLKEIRTIQ